MTAPKAGFSYRTTPAFAVGGLGWEPDPAAPSEGFNNIPLGGWVCFHCSERFTNAIAARKHFGITPQDVPACLESEKAL